MEILKIEADKIIVASDRVRKEFDKEKLQRLATSFRAVGQIQPGVCVELGEGKYLLVAGERRLRACRLAGIPFSFVLQSEADEAMLLEIEIEENLNRENLTWQEEVEGLDKLHRLREGQKAKGHQTQSLDDTALEVDKSRASVHRDLELAEWSKEFPEVRDAKSKADAYKIIKKYKAELLRNQLLQQAIGKDACAPKPDINSPEAEAFFKECVTVGSVVIPKALLLEFDERIIQGRMEDELEKFPDGSFGTVFFDPPWGVNLTQIRESNAHTEEFDDAPETFSDNIEGWISRLYTKMATDSHLYLFFGIINHELVYRTLEKVGFSVNHIPLIWYKQGAHVTRNPETWHGRSYEPIAFARKGGKKLITQGSPDVIITPAPTPAMKQIHPAAKHPDIYLELIKRSCYPGEKILDPMAGSGMVGVAAECYRASKLLDWHLIEEKQEFRELALENVIKGYQGVVLKQKEEIDRSVITDYEAAPLNEDFHEYEPGSSDWMRFWKAHPEQQELMLEWKKSLTQGDTTL